MIEGLISFHSVELGAAVGCFKAHGNLRDDAEGNTMHNIEQFSLGWCHESLVRSQYSGVIVSAFLG